MRTIVLSVGVAAVVAISTAARAPQPPAVDMVVNASWLKQHLNDNDLVILGLDMPGMANMSEAYAKGHIHGARMLDANAIVQGDGSNGTNTMELVSADSLRRVLESLGVNTKSRVLLYGPTAWTTLTARAWFTFDQLGLGDRTYILDGGSKAWIAAGEAMETAVPTVTRGSLTLPPSPGRVADLEFVKAHVNDPSLTIIDARAPEFYNGTKLGHQAARTGHIPSAKNVYYTSLLDTVAGTWRAPSEARAMLQKAGVALDKPVVVYCHIGQTANVVYTQARRLGLNVKLYDGSFQDWSKRSELPVEAGKGAKE